MTQAASNYCRWVIEDSSTKSNWVRMAFANKFANCFATSNNTHCNRKPDDITACESHKPSFRHQTGGWMGRWISSHDESYDFSEFLSPTERFSVKITEHFLLCKFSSEFQKDVWKGTNVSVFLQWGQCGQTWKRETLLINDDSTDPTIQKFKIKTEKNFRKPKLNVNSMKFI